MNPELIAIIEDYARTHGLNLPPHQIVSDMVAGGPSGVEQLLAMLGVSINAGDPADNAQAQAGQAEREARLTDAQAKFPANEEQSAAQLAGVGGRDPMSQMSQLSGLTGIGQSLGGALSGTMQPFAQLGQQVPSAGMQAMQAGMGALQHGASSAATAGALHGGLLGAGGGLGAAGSGLAGAAGGAAGTVPSSPLGPPPTPSANTAPASSPTTSPVPPGSAEATRMARGGMAGMPMVPPGAMQGAGGTGSDAKADTKRVVPPSVKNGSPVQGRISPPPATPEVVKRVEGKPVATRRIVAPDQKPEADGADQGS
jgi:hypothetical protein